MASAAVKEFTDGNFDAEVLQANVPVVVDFWAEWCMPCRMLAPIIDSVAEETAGKVKVGKVDVDQHREVAGRYGITSIPTVLVFKGGKVVKKFVGFMQKDKLLAALNEAGVA
jgi:thioredoxin 1